MRLIITRPQEDAGLLADKLAILGHEAVVLPLINIVPQSETLIPDLPWQAICITSANALRARSCSDALKKLPLLSVGPQSLAEARHQGFQRATAHGGDVNGLSMHIAAHLDPAAGPLLYLSGTETSADLAAKLKHRGFVVHRIIVYDTEPMVPENLAAELQQADGVLLYSPRTALHWVSALQMAHLVDMSKSRMHFCLSPNVAAKLPRDFRHRIAATPDENAMLMLLDQHHEAE